MAMTCIAVFDIPLLVVKIIIVCDTTIPLVISYGGTGTSRLHVLDGIMQVFDDLPQGSSLSMRTVFYSVRSLQESL